METAVENAAPPVVAKTESSVTSERSQEVKQIANGTVETTASSEKTVSQTVTVSGDQQQRYKFAIVIIKCKKAKCVVHFAAAASFQRSNKNHRLQLLW